MPEDFFNTMMAATKQPTDASPYAARPVQQPQGTNWAGMGLAGKPFFNAAMPLPQPVASAPPTNAAAMNPAHPGFAATQPPVAAAPTPTPAPARSWWEDFNYGSSAP